MEFSVSHVLIVIGAEYLILILPLACVILYRRGERSYAIQAILAGLIGFVISETLKLLINDPRPYVLDGTESLLRNPPSNGSFPSGHTTVSIAIAWSIYLYNRQLGIWMIICALIVGICRILVRVHAPVDIVGGITLGICIAYLVRGFFNKHNVVNPKKGRNP